MKCPICEKDGLRVKIKITLDIEASDLYHINKSIVRKSSTTIESAERRDVMCYCPNCYWMEG